MTTPERARDVLNAEGFLGAEWGVRRTDAEGCVLVGTRLGPREVRIPPDVAIEVADRLRPCEAPAPPRRAPGPGELDLALLGLCFLAFAAACRADMQERAVLAAVGVCSLVPFLSLLLALLGGRPRLPPPAARPRATETRESPDAGGSPVPEQLKAPRCRPRPDLAVVNVMFERGISGDELDALRESRRSGVIAADPDEELGLAAAQQLAAELQQACDHAGLAGRFLVHDVVRGLGFDDDDDPESPARPKRPRP